jgi:APA family basic amino acid/polyamine antiporter
MTRQDLRRSLTLPWLVFYGVGVTVGAGIFALIGEVFAMSGDQIVYAFLLAGLVAGITGYSYVLLASVYPKAAGEAFFVKHGMGALAGRIIGYLVIAVAITSAAVIALAFARYLQSIFPIPENICLVSVVVLLALIAMVGVRESVAFAAVITVLEVGTLLVVAVIGWPFLAQNDSLHLLLVPPQTQVGLSAMAAGAFLAFFAFIGFEDIENMAEETKNAERNVPYAIVLTLVISMVLYILLALIFASMPNREALAASKAPLAELFASATGRSGAVIAAMAAIAMVNGVLIQIIMASRVIYGMSREQLLPEFLGRVHVKRQTPVIATSLVSAAVLLLGLLVPLRQLAELTSLAMLLVFAAVNLSLFLIGRSPTAAPKLRRWRLWGILGMLVALALVVAQAVGLALA